MNKGYFITGTDTGVGKTVVTAGLLAGIRQRGVNAVAMKPVQSGAVMVDCRLVSEDARFYLRLADLAIDPCDLNCYSFPAPVSPHLAAELSGDKFDSDVVKKAYNRLADQYPVILVEGAGGLCVPLSGNWFTVADLAGELGLPLIVVARVSLGTINHSVLTVKWAQHLGLTVKGVIFNGCRPGCRDEIEESSVSSITRMTGVPVLGRVPAVAGLSVENNLPGNLSEAMQSSIDWDVLIG